MTSQLEPVDWEVTYGNARGKQAPITIRVRAETCGQAKEKAREIARKHGYFGRMGTIRMVQKEVA